MFINDNIYNINNANKLNFKNRKIINLDKISVKKVNLQLRLRLNKIFLGIKTFLNR